MWHAFGICDYVMALGLPANDWDQYDGPDSYMPSTVAPALKALLSATSQESARVAYHRTLSAIGNNHAGTMYPAAIGVTAWLRLVRDTAESEWARWAAVEVLTDLTESFVAEPRFETTRTPSGERCNVVEKVRSIAATVDEGSVRPLRRPDESEWTESKQRYPPGTKVTGTVANQLPFGVFLSLAGTAVPVLALLPNLFPLHASPAQRNEWPSRGTTVEAIVAGHAEGRLQIDVQPTRFRSRFGEEIFSLSLEGATRNELALRVASVFPLDPELSTGGSWDAMVDALAGGLVAENITSLSIWVTGLTALAEDAHRFIDVLEQVASIAAEPKPIGSESSVTIVTDWPIRPERDFTRTPLHDLARARDESPQLLRLLEAGADPNSSDQDGWSALHHAAVHGYATNVSWLLQHRANAEAKTTTGLRPIDLARRNGHTETTLVLEKEEDA